MEGATEEQQKLLLMAFGRELMNGPFISFNRFFSSNKMCDNIFFFIWLAGVFNSVQYSTKRKKNI